MTFRSAVPLLLLLGLPGCRRTDRRNTVVAAPTSSRNAAAMEAPVRLTAAQKARWTGMKLGVIDLAAKKETPVDVPVGSEFALPGSDLRVRILALVPDFTLDNGVITSRTDQDRNPAAQVLLTENGRELFRGWLFARFPETHPFEHPRYALRLLELEPEKAP
ncbi:MAG TPA: hypothetical protein VF768_04880 [Holophagaceae bacterium]